MMEEGGGKAVFSVEWESNAIALAHNIQCKVQNIILKQSNVMHGDTDNNTYTV